MSRARQRRDEMLLGLHCETPSQGYRYPNIEDLENEPCLVTNTRRCSEAYSYTALMKFNGMRACHFHTLGPKYSHDSKGTMALRCSQREPRTSVTGSCWSLAVNLDHVNFGFEERDESPLNVRPVPVFMTLNFRKAFFVTVRMYCSKIQAVQLSQRIFCLRRFLLEEASWMGKRDYDHFGYWYWPQKSRTLAIPPLLLVEAWFPLMNFSGTWLWPVPVCTISLTPSTSSLE